MFLDEVSTAWHMTSIHKQASPEAVNKCLTIFTSFLSNVSHILFHFLVLSVMDFSPPLFLSPGLVKERISSSLI